jgi:hypothetical protein
MGELGINGRTWDTCKDLEQTEEAGMRGEAWNE